MVCRGDKDELIAAGFDERKAYCTRLRDNDQEACFDPLNSAFFEALPFNPFTYYVGLWEGIDPDDGPNLQRSIIPIPGQPRNFAIAGRVEYSQFCGQARAESLNVTALPNGTQALVPGLLTGSNGELDPISGILKTVNNLLCFGDDEPLNSNPIPVEWIPFSKGILNERAAFRPDLPTPLHRTTSEYEGSFSD